MMRGEGLYSERFHRKRRGMTLIELLISLFLVLIISGTVGGLLFMYVNHYEQVAEISAARQRGEMVLSIIEGPVLHSGMGMPNSSDLFDNAFSIGSGVVPFKSWSGPLDIADNGSCGDELRVVYSSPTNMVVQESDATNDTISFNMSADLGAFESGLGNSLKNWAIFPSIEEPFLIEGKGGVSLTVSASCDVEKVAVFDNLCALNTMRALVKDLEGGLPGFYTDYGPGEHLRVEGVGALHFEWNPEMNTLVISVLAMGDTRHGGEVTRGNVPFWDEDNWGWTEEYRHYRLVVVSDRWRVRN